jgi:hypothetical protein
MRLAHKPVGTFRLRGKFVAGASDQIKRACQIVARLVALIRILRKAPRSYPIESSRNGRIAL